MRARWAAVAVLLASCLVLLAMADSRHQAGDNARHLVRQGQQVFRFDTFGDEAFWGGVLGLHKAIEGSKFGGVGPGVSPRTALAVGLKVDSAALPENVVDALKRGQVNLDDPATTLALLKLNAVVGVKGFFNSDGSLQAVGIQCALCHSTVDNSFAPGIGQRLDGWANRDLNVGAIVALSPNLQPVADLLNKGLPPPGVTVDTVRAVLNSWGPGKFDAELFLDGKAFNPQQVSNGVVTGTNVSAATLIPPAFGLAGVNLHTWTGWGSIPHWNAFVANLEMHGIGHFKDSRLRDATKFPVAAANHFDNVAPPPGQVDLITPKLAALQAYQLSIAAPAPPEGSFDAAAAKRGEQVFNTKGCAGCHVPPTFTESGWNLHNGAANTPGLICLDDFQAKRAPDNGYRTSPLNGLWTHTKGAFDLGPMANTGYFHDGRFATLTDVVNHYNTCFHLNLNDQDKSDLVEYLKSLPAQDQQQADDQGDNGDHD